jgi:two-component system, NarL family, nitrate/nitrite response regulator NarL
MVLATANTTVAGIAAVATHQPDACVLDLRFPDWPDGLEAARIIRRCHPDIAVLVLSGLIDPAVRAEAMRIGVAGFVRKDQSVAHIADALDVIASGRVAFDSMLIARSRLGQRRGGCPSYGLTPREKEVLGRIVAGQSSRQMSREMTIQVSTLRTYVKNVFMKLDAHSRLQAAALATREHLLDEQTA